MAATTLKVFSQLLTDPGALFKSISSMRFGESGGSGGFRIVRGSQRQWEREIGDGLSSSIIVACVNWVSRNFPEAPCVVQQRAQDGEWETEPEHELAYLLEFPNPSYSGVLMWMATVVDWNISGNAYWVKVRAGSSKVVQLWWVPSTMMEPKGDEKNFVTHYEYKPGGGGDVILKPEDVVHFRNGIDPRNVRKGRGSLQPLLREIFTDDEAANFTASILANLGMPGVIIAPENWNGTGAQIEFDAQGVKQEFQRRFTGDRRGEPMVLTGPTKVQMMSWSPKELDLAALRRIPEERVSAVLGIPPMVVGFGAGLAHSTFNNYAEAREAAYDNNIIPTQRLFAADIRMQLLVDFVNEAQAPKWRVHFDLTDVRALSEDQTDIVTRMDVAIKGGWAQVAEGRKEIGLPVDKTHEVYLVPSTHVVVPAADYGQAVVVPGESPSDDPDTGKPAEPEDTAPAPKKPPKEPVEEAEPKPAPQEGAGKGILPFVEKLRRTSATPGTRT